MSEFVSITRAAELLRLGDAEFDADVVAGYRAWLRGDHPPGSDKSRAFHHGYANGCVDSGREGPTPEQRGRELAARLNAKQQRFEASEGDEA
jgi:hypothetical protein